jgi:hypothetical protein
MAGSRVSRVPVKARAKADPGPVRSAADLAENRNRGAGPTRIGANTPVTPKGAASSSVRPAGAAIRDESHAATGKTIAQRANARRPGRNGRD